MVVVGTAANGCGRGCRLESMSSHGYMSQLLRCLTTDKCGASTSHGYGMCKVIFNQSLARFLWREVLIVKSLRLRFLPRDVITTNSVRQVFPPVITVNSIRVDFMQVPIELILLVHVVPTRSTNVVPTRSTNAPNPLFRLLLRTCLRHYDGRSMMIRFWLMLCCLPCLRQPSGLTVQ